MKQYNGEQFKIWIVLRSYFLNNINILYKACSLFKELNMLLFLLFLSIISISSFFALQQAKKNDLQKRQLAILLKENNILKEKVNYNTQAQNIDIKYVKSTYKYGLIANSCSLLLSPLVSSPKLCTLTKNTKVIISDCAEITDCIWYEISFETSTNINNKGWIKSKDIILFENSILKNSCP
jgi:hypothetical protein